MASTLDSDFNKLNRIVEKYCINGKEEEAIECIEWARGYTDDNPQEDDIQEAISLVKKAGRYITEEGKPQYEQIQENVEKRLDNLLKNREGQ